ncbi:hypothetical protein ABID08_002028 [Rhizobium binae]|uniref:Bartonella effector protein BID domain-containing protein n=1 Tax=Rhizobium binae TaxID=1138190 RepID=A0ABV2MDX1_9HYPH|nr:hypothetical protein [Rhizobium binae]MBX4992861.1 hypothetical protein [Rhizobium binae]NKL49408.1 hypothetical protein [Rhizobium leguminosarum bv. viciae]QSY84196.1 hypothetical protein J2J99_10610 [Rhizobium binae]
MKLRPPPDIHEAAVEHHYARAPSGEVENDATIASLATAVRTTRLNSESLAAYADTLAKDRLLSPDAARLKLRDNALKLAEATAKKLDEAKARVQQEVAEITARTSTPPAPRDQLSAGLEAEIRARLASMPEKARDEAIGKAFAEMDGSIIAAVLRGPALLVGLSQSRQDMVRHRYRTTFHPAEEARLKRLTAALEATERSGRSFINYIASATTGSAVQIAEAAANAQAAEQAIKAVIAQQE